MGGQLDKEQREELNQFVQRFKLTEEDCRYYVDTFKIYCRSSKSTMSRVDFREFLEMMHISYSDVLIATVFSVLDTDADGELDAVEFIRYFILLTRYPVETKMQIIFDIIDRDGSGTIELAELHSFYNSLYCARTQLVYASLPVGGGREDPAKADKIDVDAVFKEMDTDGNRRVDRKEWAAQADKHGQQLLRMLDAYLGD